MTHLFLSNQRWSHTFFVLHDKNSPPPSTLLYFRKSLSETVPSSSMDHECEVAHVAGKFKGDWEQDGTCLQGRYSVQST
ncbi:hypothetical protein PNOK_0278000 [Pyrrhoderma noxium]|uniref:Uncharacterized protein n=1 Tax=Pyrrhoderma noxium TaxID=2282107 RepID=A0A286UT90_9AGAM|nr:hypothetical protein PNOK_0278000 [Pyrrhoderma noxium]